MGISRGVREQRGDKIHFVHLVRSRGDAAKPIATDVTTVSRLGGEDKTFDIIPCETV